MKKKEHIVKTVKPGSIAEELEIAPGDKVLAIDNTEIEDIFDYQFLTQDTYIEMLVEKPDGEQWLLEIDKEFDEDLGIEFENGLMDEYRHCHNKCIFCFIDQMPKGMRDTLYFKDDDSRLSFLQGNYITLTNMSDHDIDRIIRYHLAPINISFQTTNPELRCKMLHNRFAGNIFPKVQRLYEAGIEMNGQIVLCKGYNDGAELERSISDLSKYLPHLKSVSVVPVGLSKYRDGLAPLEPFTREDAKEVLATIHKWQKKLYEQWGLHFIHAGDEWYLLSAKESILSEDPVDGLDVAVLQDFLLTPILGIGDPRVDKRIDFIGGIRGLKELEDRVHNDMAIAFSMFPTSISELFDVADADMLMPPKSTWFEPKLRSGIFIHRIEE